MLIGLVGKPSSGKSSFFKAATMLDVKISPIPFTTIEPNVGIGYVVLDCVEKEFNLKCTPNHGFCRNGKRFVPIKLIDVAGLVPGAHEGRGLGNKFLDDLRQASALIHIVDMSGLTDVEGKPTSKHDPEEDIKFLEDEIDFWFASIIQKILPKITKVKSKSELVELLYKQLSGLEVSKQQVEEACSKFPSISSFEFAKYLRSISKPILVAANKIDLKEAQENFERVKGKFQNLIPTSAEAEIALKKAAEKGFVEYSIGNGFTIKDKSKLSKPQIQILEKIENEVLKKYGSTGVQECLQKAVFELLNYIAVYPVADANKLTDTKGKVLPDVFLVPKGTTAKELAYKIHTTMGEKFIAGVDARTKKRLAADYILKSNDVIEIVFAK
jgi:ribosome-binding ATPase YchF (GTP1/OBG family)